LCVCARRRRDASAETTRATILLDSDCWSVLIFNATRTCDCALRDGSGDDDDDDNDDDDDVRVTDDIIDDACGLTRA
jgi:hypothetical protein